MFVLLKKEVKNMSNAEIEALKEMVRSLSHSVEDLTSEVHLIKKELEEMRK